ncbi:MAG: hypothetical protein WAM11_13500 [Cyanobium sp.]
MVFWPTRSHLRISMLDASGIRVRPVCVSQLWGSRAAGTGSARLRRGAFEANPGRGGDLA